MRPITDVTQGVLSLTPPLHSLITGAVSCSVQAHGQSGTGTEILWTGAKTESDAVDGLSAHVRNG